MVPGQRNKFGAPMLKPEVFWKQMHLIEESTCDIVGTFCPPHSDLALGKWAPLAPLVTPLSKNDPDSFAIHLIFYQTANKDFKFILIFLLKVLLLSHYVITTVTQHESNMQSGYQAALTTNQNFGLPCSFQQEWCWA